MGRPGGETLAPMLVALRTALPPEGELHLRPGRAGSAALADDEGVPTLFTAFTLLSHEEAGLRRVSPALCAHG